MYISIDYILTFFIGPKINKIWLLCKKKARNCLMSFDMGHIRGKEKRRSLEKSMAHKGSLNGLTFSNTSRHLVTYGCFDGRVRKWDIM